MRDAIAVRFAIANGKRGRAKLQARRTVMLLLGATLSVGGITQGVQNADFLIEKDIDQVKVIRRGPSGEKKVVANVGDSFAANSLYKLAGLAPEGLVTRQSNLVDSNWFVQSADSSVVKKEAESIGEQISLFNDSVREKFFKTSLPYGDIIHEKAEKYDVDPALVAAVVEAESRFKHRARSQVGAQGLMQLMPKTGRWMGARNLYDPAQNVDAGAKYLKYLQERFDGNLTKTIAAYNAGEGNVRRFNGVPPYRETRTYVKRVMSNYNKRNQQLEQFKENMADESADLGR